MTERFVVLGLGQARSSWFGDLARIANAGGLPLEFVKCVSHEEARVRLSSGRAFSALLVDGGLPGVDRDLLDAARRVGVEVLIVDDPRIRRDWDALGATAVLPRDFSPSDLIASLSALTRAIPRSVADEPHTAQPAQLWSGQLVAVTGARGTGASTVAAALAQGLAAHGGRPGAALLADLALDADQGVLHHAPDVVPGVPELVEAHRAGALSPAAVQSMVFDVEERGYHLLLGLRRRRGWAALRPRALEAALDSLLAAYPLVVGDVDPDVDGHHECGSFEVEERNAIARAVHARASATVVVGAASVGGLHSLARVLQDICEHGVDPAQLITVVNHAPRSPRERAAIARALPTLGGSGGAEHSLAAPIFIPTRRGVEDAVRSGRPLPSSVASPLSRAVTSVLEGRDLVIDLRDRAAPIVAGSLGHWSGAEADAV
jgi:hypothetical protein